MVVYLAYILPLMGKSPYTCNNPWSIDATDLLVWHHIRREYTSQRLYDTDWHNCCNNLFCPENAKERMSHPQ
jgi:hypothetical protein